MKNKTKLNIWKWFKIVEEYETHEITMPAFAKKKNIKIDDFRHYRRLINLFTKTNPELQIERKQLYDQYLESGLSVPKFCTEQGANKTILKIAVDHFRAREVIAEAQENPNIVAEWEKSMEFIKAPVIKSASFPTSRQTEPEVIKKQNDVELIISKGVKVVVAPEVGADKLVRIIELLKDL